MKVNYQEKENGITLIALVITIIVLLILAGISISMVLGQNGVLKKSEEAIIQTKVAQINEQAQFIAGIAASEQYQGNTFKESVKEGLKSYKNFEQTPEISADEKTATITETETGRQYEINSLFEVKYVGTTEGGNSESTKSKLTDVVKLGDYVAYTPPSQSYTMTTAQTGYTSDQTYNTSSYTGGWQVLYNDGTYGLQIISSDNILVNDTSTKLYLTGVDGYNNLVETLNTMAGKYVNTTYAQSGRSVGSLPSDTETSTGKSELYTGKYTYFKTFGWNGLFKVGYDTYAKDISAMSSANFPYLNYKFFLASRYLQDLPDYTDSYGNTTPARASLICPVSTKGTPALRGSSMVQ